MYEERLGCWLAEIGIHPYTFFTIVLVIGIIGLMLFAYSLGKDAGRKNLPKPAPKPKPQVVVYPPDCFYDQEKDK